MKSFFKRSAIGLAVIGVAGSVYAMPAAAAGGMPSMHGYFIGVEALRLRPMNGDLDVIDATHSGGTSDFGDIAAAETDYNWSWRVFGGLKFGDHDDLTVSWFRMRNSSSDRYNFDSDDSFDTRWDVGGDDFYDHVDFDVDNVYAVLGHTVNFNNPWSMRFAGGVEYAHVESDLTLRGTTSSGTPVVEQTTSESDMKGWGPRGEFDITYHLPNNFALFANTAVTLLAATRDVDVDDYFQSGSSVATTDFDDFSTRHVVVPKFNMRLGASYTYMFGQAGAEGGSCLTLAAGWQVESYVHAIERADWNYDDGDPFTKTSNFGDQGLFLGVTFGSSWM